MAGRWPAKEDQPVLSYEDTLFTDGFGRPTPIALYARRTNDRIHAQRGGFSLHGDDIAPLEQMRNTDKFLRKIVLPPTALPEAKNFLRLAGIDHHALFPDLQGLSQTLVDRYSVSNQAIRPVT
jgi:hypothetical protein